MVRVASVDKSTCLDAVPAGDGACDGVLRWFEAYAEALSAGRFAVEALELEYAESRSISLFPQLQPWCSQAVTEVGTSCRAVPCCASMPYSCRCDSEKCEFMSKAGLFTAGCACGGLPAVHS